MENFEKKKVLLTLPETVANGFQSKYPRLMTVFLRRCLMKANEDRQFFEEVFFGVKDKYSLLGQYRPEYVLQDD